MKKRQLLATGLCLIFGFGSIFAQPQTKSELAKFLDFHGSIKAIAEAVKNGTIRKNQLYLITANVDTVSVYRQKTTDPDSAISRVELTITEAYWNQDNTAIDQFPAIVMLGSQFFGQVSDALSDDPAILSPRKNIIAVVRWQKSQSRGDQQIPVLEMIDFRLR